MKMSLDAEQQLTASFEGYSDMAYKPTPNDVWTIGYGHTQGVKEWDLCDRETALQWLSEDLGWAEAAVNELVTVPLTQYQFDALVDLVFNIGRTNFANSTLLRELNQGNYQQDANFARWVFQNGVVLDGLKRRRAAEAQWFNTGKL